ncbi:glycosyltransferase family 4 protein [Limisphaera ngatamarikiensis]|uniref:Glycosyltransferase family 4 protein n=1 Tax=Limisphaera ngatamarikiensis TaxID=1324935 RepID=A0A6M1RQA6_9BACT|nr:glycosyltransferase family 4 protein [Limisphaera ngatamarikiensis]NGO39863.1 glycosyltransferase family 4 protein [Limisphaera ngatamarikiensis]
MAPTPCILTAGTPKRIGFISTRFRGTDGVTLEARKWARILEGLEHQCFWMAGELDAPPEVSHHVPLAFFGHPEVADLQARLFGVTTRSRETTDRIQAIKQQLKEEIYRFLDRFNIEVVVPENILSLPMHVPLGLAMTEVLAETGLPAIAHHHDFTWERERYVISAVNDYLRCAFPPSLHRIEHVVINSMAQKELARRCSLPSAIIPNVLDFETPPPGIDDYNRDLRREIGLAEDDWLILQPTRVVPRKGIEHAVELVRRLKDPRAKLVISHPAGDEGNAYVAMLQDRIADAGIEVKFIADRVGEHRGVNAAGQKVYTLFDIYPHADLVTYPSYYEGFGNAFLEAIYFGKPVVVNSYAVYARDIAPLGFRTITMSNLVTRETVEQVREILRNHQLREEWARTNYQLGLKYFSFAVARRKLVARLANLFGEGL